MNFCPLCGAGISSSFEPCPNCGVHPFAFNIPKSQPPVLTLSAIEALVHASYADDDTPAEFIQRLRDAFPAASLTALLTLDAVIRVIEQGRDNLFDAPGESELCTEDLLIKRLRAAFPDAR